LTQDVPIAFLFLWNENNNSLMAISRYFL
jgi:hypothetical protein